jgi:hypothetical protein
MNNLDSRLSAWNPIRAEEMLDAAASAEAVGLLQRILSQPIASPSRRQSYRPRWPAQAWIAAAAAVAIAVAAAGIAATIPSPARNTSTHKVSAGPPVTGFQPGPSQGVAKNALQLVRYATRSAAMTPVFVPGPRDWEYREVLYGRTVRAAGVGVGQSWEQVGTGRDATSWHRGKITYGYKPGPRARIAGWPTTYGNIYHYLASLPSGSATLRRIILANNHSSPAQAFNTIGALLFNFPLPARFQAELYAVLISLPGVHFTRHAVDAVGRHGVGLYRIQHGYLDEIIINPRTYLYMGGLTIAARGHTSYSTLLAHPRKATIFAWSATLGSGIVSQPGQVP